MDLLQLLKELSEAPGPSGFEGQAADLVKEKWEPLVDTISQDRLGSVIAVKKGRGPEPRPRLMLAAHVDEIGLMVSRIVAHPDQDDGAGFLRVTSLGGVDIRHLYGQTVTVHGSGPEGGEMVGILGALPHSMRPEDKRSQPYDYEELVVDVGLSAAELRQRVAVGDPIIFRQTLRELMNKRVAGKALDNRASVAAVTVCLEYLNGRFHDWDVVAVATIQEETRLLGAYTTAFAEKPDVAVAIDVTFAKGPGTSDPTSFEIDKGIPLSFGPNVHDGVYQGLKDAAKALEMDVVDEPHSRYSGTDAFGLQVAREGIPTGLVAIPLRYMHTMVESASIADIERVGRLLGEFAARLDENFLTDIAAALMDEESK